MVYFRISKVYVLYVLVPLVLLIHVFIQYSTNLTWQVTMIHQLWSTEINIYTSFLVRVLIFLHVSSIKVAHFLR